LFDTCKRHILVTTLVVVNVHLGCAAGKIGVEIWQDFLECVGAVVNKPIDENVPASHVQSLSSSQVCSLLCHDWLQLSLVNIV